MHVTHEANRDTKKEGLSGEWAREASRSWDDYTLSVIPTGIRPVDLALDGGLARGGIVVINGPAMAGKSTLVYHALAEAQRLGAGCAYIEVGRQLDILYAQRIGVNLGGLRKVRGATGEDALKQAMELMWSRAADVIAIDCVTPWIPSRRVMTQLQNFAQRSGAVCLITFQTDHPRSSGPDARRYLKLFGTQRLDIRPLDGSAEFDRVQVKVARNCFGMSRGTALLDITYDEGVSEIGCVLDLAVERGIVTDSVWGLFYDDLVLGLDRSKAKAFLRLHPRIAEELKAKAYQQNLLDSTSTTEEAPVLGLE
jgi:recombination protein RecA